MSTATTHNRIEMTVEEARAGGLLDSASRQRRRNISTWDSKARRTLENEIRLAARAGNWFVREEFQFARPRRWRADWAIAPSESFEPCLTTLIEFEGGTWAWKNDGEIGKHQAERFVKDCEKYSFASVKGYIIVRVTADMVADGTALWLIQQAMEAR